MDTEVVADVGTSFPSIEEGLRLYRENEKIRGYAHHNHFFWRCIHGGLEMVRQNPLDFDPIAEYWYLTERRLLVAFFDKVIGRRPVPADSLRRLAFKVFRHFQRAREDGRFGEPALVGAAGLWPSFCDQMIEVTSELGEFQEYQDLRKVWGKKIHYASLREALVEYLTKATPKDNLGQLERAFFLRLGWFPYVGLTALEDLGSRQRFWYGYYQLMSSTNSYVRGGSMSFAPVMQNNRTTEILSRVDRWAEGETPDATGFYVEGKSGKTEKKDHAPVVELYGFLNLHRVPFTNSVTKNVYEALSEPEDKSVYDLLDRIGERTRSALSDHPDKVTELSKEFLTLTESPPKDPGLVMEKTSLKIVNKRFPEEAKKIIDPHLVRELNAGALKKARSLSDMETAVAMAHLLIDAHFYGLKQDGPPVIKDPDEPYRIIDDPKKLHLPPSLSTVANDALGYLASGHHVLFAGPPGTGKTTVAQLVGHAWDHSLGEVPDEIRLDEAPQTTVGNSAWSPFHTIGGILPDKENKFVLSPGIFVDPSTKNEKDWELVPGCIVLDEMNRADLDRCIGELYPLLSRSVSQVHPAGIPGVRSIRLSPRFRIVATVNDATLDDIVFPISEGLARRFIRLELLGATMDDLSGFLSSDKDGAAERQDALQPVIDQLYEICDEEDRIEKSELGLHLPFGVGYFGTLRDWVRGDLKLSQPFMEQDLENQARQLLMHGLTSVVRVRNLKSILEKLKAEEVEA